MVPLLSPCRKIIRPFEHLGQRQSLSVRAWGGQKRGVDRAWALKRPGLAVSRHASGIYRTSYPTRALITMISPEPATGSAKTGCYRKQTWNSSDKRYRSRAVCTALSLGFGSLDSAEEW